MKPVIWMGLVGLVALTTACATATTPAATTPPVAVGGDCTAASPNTCSADGKQLLTCDTATKKFKEKEVCASGTKCAVTGGAAACPGAAATDAVSGDATGADAGGTADTGKDVPEVKDIKDVKDVPPKPTKCDQTDNACISKCSADLCKVENEACAAMLECTTLTVCLGNCAKGVSPPEAVTGTNCQEKCLTLTPEKGKKAYSAIQNCTVNDCLQCDSAKAGYDQCTQNCIVTKCAEQVDNCFKNSCGDFFTCVDKQKCISANGTQDQACIGKCAGAMDSAGKTSFGALQSCLQDNKPLCE